jgi:hypothetical protein
MKKALIALVAACSIGAIAYASLADRGTTKQKIEKNQEEKKTKKECRHTCLFG